MSSAVVMSVERRTCIPYDLSPDRLSTDQPAIRPSRSQVDNRDRRSHVSTDALRLSHVRGSEQLHGALVGISRGLLQYASQCAPWTSVDDQCRAMQLSRLVAMQQTSIQRLVDLLTERGYPITWGVFPAEDTCFNYVALKFLWPKIADFQKGLIRMLDTVRFELSHDIQATAVLDDIIQTERFIATELATYNRTDTRFVPVNHTRIDTFAKPMWRSFGRYIYIS